jgi:hypothetical protein
MYYAIVALRAVLTAMFVAIMCVVLPFAFMYGVARVIPSVARDVTPTLRAKIDELWTIG